MLDSVSEGGRCLRPKVDGKTSLEGIFVGGKNPMGQLYLRRVFKEGSKVF
jgi:hypothetical protein